MSHAYNTPAPQARTARGRFPWSAHGANRGAHRLPGATVLQTRSSRLRSHAKFLIVDSRYVVVTSANVSKSAERFNVELGLVVENRTTAEQIERQMRLLEASIYTTVRR